MQRAVKIAVRIKERRCGINAYARSRLGAVLMLVAAEASANIRLTHHDWSMMGFSGGEICVVCHTPHPGTPLWNHDITASVFTLYNSATLDAVPGQPDGPSKLCLSCHDGTVAVDSFGGNAGAVFNGFSNLGTDFTRHHPISLVYDAALAAADGELFDPAVTPSGLGGTIDQNMLRNGKLQCVSCHDVHLGRVSNGCPDCHNAFGDTVTLSLWKSNAGSALCLTCHDK